jgi:tetratricopeptide (TPR) repeat protein
VNDQRIRALLEKADRAAGPPAYRRPTAAGIRRRLHRRRLVRLGMPALAAAGVLVATAVGVLCLRPEPPQLQPPTEPQRIASLETQVRQLQTQTEAALKLVREVLERDRQDRRLAALQAELARIPDPRREMDAQADKTAFLLIYQADRLYKELNRTESAVAQYKEIIQLFPKNRWADVARERLAEIERHQINQSNPRKGAAPCESRNV